MTVLARRQFTVTDQAGNIVPGASIEVKQQLVGGQPLATLYSDRAGASPIANPFTADSNGFAFFHAAGGVYRIRAYLGPSGAPTFEQIFQYVSMGNLDEVDYDTDGTLASNSDGLIPTQKAVKTYVDAAVAVSDAMVFKGSIDCSANPNYPAADRGWTYRVSVAGKIGGSSGIVVEIGDLATCLDDGTASGNQATVGSHWTVTQTNIDGAVVGPASATSGHITTFNGTTGKLVQDSGKAIPSGAVVGDSDTQTLTNKTIAGGSNTISGIALVSCANQTAYTLVGNFTGSSAPPTASAISGLTAKSSPASTDLLLIQDQAASGQLKQSTIAQVVGALASGVSSIVSNTGAFTLSHGLTNSTNDLRIDVSILRGYLAGLLLSTAGSSATFGISVGVAVDSTSADFMKLTSAYTKTTSSWAVGTGNGALDTGTIANSTWYHVHLIKRPDTGVVDVLISLSASAPTLPTNYTLFRRIGSIKTNGSAQWVLFTQVGDKFTWGTPISETNFASTLNILSTVTLLGVPPGLKLLADMDVNGLPTSGTVFLSVWDPDATKNGNYVAGGASGSAVAASFTVQTNTSNQVKVTVSANTLSSAVFETVGYTDRRGRDL